MSQKHNLGLKINLILKLWGLNKDLQEFSFEPQGNTFVVVCTSKLLLLSCHFSDAEQKIFLLMIHKIHLIPKWQPINYWGGRNRGVNLPPPYSVPPPHYFFVRMLISPLGLVSMYKTQKNFEVKTRQRGLINMETKNNLLAAILE